MEINIRSDAEIEKIYGFLAVFLLEGEEKKWFDKNELSFTAEDGKKCLVVKDKKIYFLFGLGKESNLTLEKLTSGIALAAAAAEDQKISQLSFVLPQTKFSDVDLAKIITLTINLSLYHFHKYKKEKKQFLIEKLDLYFAALNASRIKSLKRGLELGNVFSIAVNYCRDLVNEPAKICTPSFLAAEALKLAKGNDDLEVTVFDEKKMKKQGMEASLAIAQGSAQEPRFIKLDYKPKKFVKKVVLVGKGITFDSGGLSIKHSESMENMKIDMAGAAVVLSVFKVIQNFNLPLNVIGLISAVENLPSGMSVKPGDVVSSFSGKTIEILNTDAEGRVTLADSLAYGASLKPNYMIDLATLTGACIVALGEEVAGLMANDKKLSDIILESAKTENEKIWPLPLEENYRTMLKSNVADLKNTTKKYGGALTAGLFLQEFVENTPWAHLDVAGPVWLEKKTDVLEEGASGFGVRTILRLLINLI